MPRPIKDGERINRGNAVAVSLQWPTTAWKRAFRRRLLTWYPRNQRKLPWRGTSDPYAVWISEIMLQQTQVSTVVPYFERFLTTFPDVRSLARSTEQDVLKLWEGLGYYRRARQLHRAAQVIVDEHDGNFPSALHLIRELPGIGRYTAAAIASIAFDLPAPILEANTARLYARLMVLREDRDSAAAQKLLWQLAEELLPDRATGIFNQALMELGSLVCTPRAPSCETCPVVELCPTFRQGLQESIPVARARPRTEAVREAFVVVRRGGKVLLRMRGARERWAGMWDFPRFPLDARRQPGIGQELAKNVERTLGVVIEAGEHLATIKHGVTRFRITLDCYAARYVSAKWPRPGNGESIRWLDVDELAGVPLSTSARRLCRILETKAGGAKSPASLD